MAEQNQRVRAAVVLGLGAVVLVVAGGAFVHKMTEFALTIMKDDVEGFGAVAIAIYLIGMLPIVFLNLWAIASGRFRNVEAPKYRIFELDHEIERGGELEQSHG